MRLALRLVRRVRRVSLAGETRRERHGARAQIVRRREKPAEDLVAPLDERRHGPEIAQQPKRRQPYAADAEIARAQETTYLRLAKLIDRLHRIADDEERAAIARLPAGGERLEELELRHGGVLEFVDQNVTQRESGPQRELGRQPGLRQRRASRPRDVRMIDAAIERKQRLQLRGRRAQHAGQGGKRRGVVRSDLRARERGHLEERRARRRQRAQALDAGPERLLAGAVLESRSEPAGDGSAP